MFPIEILAIISAFSKPLTRPDWKTAKKFTNYKLRYYLKNINPRYKINYNKIMNPRYFTIKDLPSTIRINQTFNYKDKILKVIQIDTYIDNNDQSKIICKDKSNKIYDAKLHRRLIVLSNENTAIREIIYIDKQSISMYDMI